MSIFHLSNVTKCYKNGLNKTYALSNVSISFPTKGLVSITGKSGSGKSTLLNILMGLEKPTSGEVIFDKKRLSKMSKREFSYYHLYYVSMVYQHYNLFDNLSSFDNVALPLKMRGENKKRVKKEVNILFERFNLEYLINQKCSTLSGGEAQRVAILRALIINPEIILCDEPTGALDSNNSILVMETLKKISKKKLVIMVSHNESLVNTYSDRVITLKDGEKISDTNSKYIPKSFLGKLKKKYRSNWKHKFIKKNLKENRKKNIFSLVSLLFGFVSILLSIGFYLGSKSSTENMIFSSLGSEYLKLSNKSLYKIENSPLSYEKSTRPSEEDVREFKKKFPHTEVVFNFDYLFPIYQECSFNKEMIDSPMFIPVYSFVDNPILDELTISGTKLDKDSIDEVVVNEEFVKYLSKSNEEVIDEYLLITNESEITYLTNDNNNPIIKDTFSYTLKLRIAAVIKEFSFLNSPKVYYSSLAIEEELTNVIVDNLSEYRGETLTIYDYLSECLNDNEVSGYSYNVFSTNKEEIKRLLSYKEELSSQSDGLQIESSSFEIYSSYKSFMDSLANALIVFVIIAFVGVNFILGMLTLSSFIARKKESAILTCLGAKDSSIISIFLSENYLIILISYLLALGSSIPLQILLNKVLEQSFGLNNLINIPYLSFLRVPFLLPLGLFIVLIIVSSVFLLIPILIYKNKSVTDELRDE